MALWIALGLAFSPIALDLAGHLGAHPWARYALVFPLLFVRCARRDGGGPRSSLGLFGIAAGLALELGAVFAGAIRWARPAPVLAAIGLCQQRGVGSWRSQTLLLFAIPLPAFVVKLAERGVASAMAEAAAAIWSLGGSALTLAGAVLAVEGEPLLVINRQWLAMAPLLVGLAWYDGALLRRPLAATLATCAAAAAFALPFQTSVLVAAIGVALAGATSAAQLLVDDGSWLGATLVGVALSEARLRRAMEAT